MRIVLFAPINNSQYSRAVVHQLLNIAAINFQAIMVRNLWNINRIKNEIHRDGARLFTKVIKKIFLSPKPTNSYTPDFRKSTARDQESNKGTLRKIARENQIKYVIVQNFNNEISEKFLCEIKPDLIIFTGGGLIRKNILSIPKIGILNCHTGILPNYRGMDVVEWTALEEAIDKIGFGVTLHFMDKGVDSGPILLTHEEPIKKDDTFSSIRERLEVRMAQLMLEGIEKIMNNAVHPIEQKQNEGKQYFVMHPRLKRIAIEKLSLYLKSRPSLENQK